MDLLLEGIGHSYGSMEIMRDINLEIPAGKIVCIVGSSGCGKSTLLRLIGGLEKPTTGQVIQVGAPPLRALTHYPTSFKILRCFSAEQLKGTSV